VPAGVNGEHDNACDGQGQHRPDYPGQCTRGTGGNKEYGGSQHAENGYDHHNEQAASDDDMVQPGGRYLGGAVHPG
jgi:hypothetical protein